MEIEATYNKVERVRLKKFLKQPKVMICLWSKFGLSSSLFACYQYLATTALFDPKNALYGICPFSKKEIADLVNRSVDTVQDWLDELEKLSLISITPDKKIQINFYDEIYSKRASDLLNPSIERDGIQHVLGMYFPAIVYKDSPQVKEFNSISRENNTESGDLSENDIVF